MKHDDKKLIRKLSKSIKRRSKWNGTFTALVLIDGEIEERELFDVRGDVPDGLIGVYDEEVTPMLLREDIAAAFENARPQFIDYWTWQSSEPIQIPAWPVG